LEICAATLFQRQFVNCSVRSPQRISQGRSTEDNGRYSLEIALIVDESRLDRDARLA
jgi:hypothetical protein